jgi:signal transduction histidine kinase
VALVGLGANSEHALELVSGIVREAFCPVIAVTHSHDPVWVNDAAKRGVYAYILEQNPEELQNAIEITLRRFAEYQDIHGALERRNAESLRELELAQLRERDALEVHDGVVQGLAVAQLALQLDRKDVSRAALEATLRQAKAIVARTVEELRLGGVSQDQLIRDAAGRAGDE